MAETRKKHAGGRPTKYKPEYCNLTAYLKACERENDTLPTVCGYAIFLGVGEQTLRDWKKSHPEFSGSLDRLKTIQKNMLINRGLLGTYNPTIAKLILCANHGMKERSDYTSDESTLAPPVIILSGDKESKEGVSL